MTIWVIIRPIEACMKFCSKDHASEGPIKVIKLEWKPPL
ncbi:hypothetical protein V6Z12_A11G354200 [Gossypium hirsutum]